MREIKFKAWDKKYKFMYDNIVTFPAENCNFYYDVSLHPGSYHLPPVRRDLADIIVLQYTGLKDKNSKEIYEGDIVRAVDRHPFTDGTYEEHFGTVIYEAPKFTFDNSDIITWEQDWEYDPSELEVIGNIYENPELLR